MRFRVRARGMGLFVASVAVLVVAGGIVNATIPGGTGVIHGCYAKTGALRVIDDSVSSCKSSERPLSWSVTGPQGPQGPIGPEGPPGPGSAAFATDGGQDPIALPNATPTTVSGTLSLPQGSYVLSGKVVVYEDDASGGQVTCQLHNAGTGGGPSVLDISDVRLFGGSVSVSEPGSMATLPLVGSITSPEGSAEISIVCTTTGSASHAQFAHLSAVEVASLQ